jgi:hypothetical protein
MGMRPLGVCLLAVFAVLLAGCQRRGPDVPPPAPLPEGEQAVRLTVLRGAGGAMAFVPIYINGQGPFAFALDTGASHSVVSTEVAEQLGLPVAGPPVQTAGVISVGELIPVRVESWRVGDVELPPLTLARVNIPNPPGRQVRLDGLLGSDVLSRYGVIKVDYDGQVLILSPTRTPDGGRGP